MKSMFKTWWADESGQTLTEYGLLILVVAVAVVAAMVYFRDEISDALQKAGRCVKSGGDGRSC
jgi:Flp pilus assembly pilin Flp